MDAPRAELLGQSLAAVIVSERAETKVSTWRSQTLQRIVGTVANRLLQPAELPVQAAVALWGPSLPCGDLRCRVVQIWGG